MALQDILLSLKAENLWYICADIGKCNDPEGNKLLALLGLLLGNHHHIRLIVAHSSGEGWRAIKTWNCDVIFISRTGTISCLPLIVILRGCEEKNGRSKGYKGSTMMQAL